MLGPDFQLDVITAWNLMSSIFDLRISAPAKKHGVQCYQKMNLPISQKPKYFSESHQTQHLLDFYVGMVTSKQKLFPKKILLLKSAL